MLQSYIGPILAVAILDHIVGSAQFHINLSHTSRSQEWVLARGRGEQSQEPALSSQSSRFKKLRLKK